MRPPGTLRSEHIDACLTDEQIIDTFTPLERKFHKWYESDDFRAKNDARPYHLREILEEQYPEETQILEKWGEFCIKWLGRSDRREEYEMSREEFLEIVRSTSCKDAKTLANRLWMYRMYDTPDLLLGESTFGGSLTGYAVVTRPHILYPDIPTEKMSNPGNPDLLDRVVLAVDATHKPSLSALLSSLSSNKRLREDLSSYSSEYDSTSSGVSSALSNSLRPATDDDFADKSPFCVFQIGALVACTGSNWSRVRENFDVLADAEWKDTGYGVVVRLDDAGHPTGEVFVIFNYWRTRNKADSGPLAEEIESRDRRNVELPDIRCLYPSCNTQFFMAKIADKLDHLREGAQIDFEILFQDRQPLTMAKKCTVKGKGSQQRPSVMIIPNDIQNAVSSGGHKRLLIVHGLYQSSG